MRKSVIKIGDKIEMTHTRSATRRKLSEKKYVSMLLDYDGRSSAKISMPIFEGRIIPLEINDEYNLCFFTSSGLYQSPARVIRRSKEGRTYILHVELLREPKKYQRRQFYRLECMLEIKYRIVSDEERTLRDFINAGNFEDETLLESYENRLEQFPKNWERALLTDISGGGVRFQCKTTGNPKDYIEVAMPLRFENETVPFRCMAKVIETVKSGAGKSENDIRCQFENIEREKQELVVRYVFEEQKRRMRKE